MTDFGELSDFGMAELPASLQWLGRRFEYELSMVRHSALSLALLVAHPAPGRQSSSAKLRS
jgi:hypothetical protein